MKSKNFITELQRLIFFFLLATTNVAVAQVDCNAVLSSDLFNYSKTTMSSDFSSTFINWVDAKKFQSTKDFEDETESFGLSIPTKIGNVGFDFDQGKVNSSENVTYSSFSEFLESKSNFKTYFFQEIKNRNSQINSWTTCIKELIDKGGLFITNNRTNSNSVAIDIWFRPKVTQTGPIILKEPEVTNGKFLTKLAGTELSAVTHKTFTFNIVDPKKDVIINFNTKNIDYSSNIIIKANKTSSNLEYKYATIVTLKAGNTVANSLYIAEKSKDDAIFEIIDNNIAPPNTVTFNHVNFYGEGGEITVRIKSKKPEVYLQCQTDKPLYGVINMTFKIKNNIWFYQIIHRKDDTPSETPYSLIAN